MLRDHLQLRGVDDESVLAAMAKVPRELFVPKRIEHSAYADKALPIGLSQTISQPYIVGLMTQLLELKSTDRVLEIGTGSGYQTAILAEIAGEVFTIERIQKLSLRARQTLARLGYRNIRFRVGDGSSGWPAMAPFDAIIVTAAAPDVPAPLSSQLAQGGRLVIPTGERHDQKLLRLRRIEGGGLKTEYVAPVAFVPLIGRYGFESPLATEFECGDE
ncbi:MAG: protein-L-isoaspartate(D-aspartate) O-methyltransferase [bacterium]|jgi:protein-L-isoaspartate(D-aspartate) O-methyltransferase